MKICIIGLDFAVVEARVLAMALNHDIEVECIHEDDLHSHDDIQALLVKEQFMRLYGVSPSKLTEYLNKQQDEHAVTVMGGSRTMKVTAEAHRLVAQATLPSHKQEPHWVTRNAKGRRY